MVIYRCFSTGDVALPADVRIARCPGCRWRDGEEPLSSVMLSLRSQPA
jgi:hypothetical protein